MSAWTTTDTLRARVRRHWENGSLLRAYAANESFTPMSIPIKGPTASEIAPQLERVRRWVVALERASEQGAAFRIEHKRVGSPAVGYSTIPARIHIEKFDQVRRLLGVQNDVEHLDTILKASANRPEVLAWVRKYPLKAIAHEECWARILDALDWIEWNRAQGKYLREIDVPGIDTKFIEAHRDILAVILGISSAKRAFVSDLGFTEKPDTIRMRFDPAALGLPGELSEGQFRVSELARLDVRVMRALIVENETSYLAVPVAPQSVVIWGKGYDVAQAGAIPWMHELHLFYWGDLDTHGFQILHRARTHLPQIESVMMDTNTLLAFRNLWGTEPNPTNAALPLLTDEESNLYAALVTDRYGQRVRLEQERISWDWVLGSLKQARYLDR